MSDRGRGPAAWVPTRAQLRHLFARPDSLQALLTTPLLTAVFLTLADTSSTGGPASYAVLAPALMALWTSLLGAAGSTITEERNNGTLELVVASPANLFLFVLRRLSLSAVIGAVALAEAWVVAAVGFGQVVRIEAPLPFLAAAVLTVAGMVSTAGALASVFVLVPSARILQNALNYPFFLLGGVLVPLALLPDALAAPGRLVFLSYGSDLLRAGIAGAPTRPLTWVMLVLLGAGALAGGAVAFRRVVDRARVEGTLLRNG